MEVYHAEFEPLLLKIAAYRGTKKYTSYWMRMGLKLIESMPIVHSESYFDSQTVVGGLLNEVMNINEDSIKASASESLNVHGAKLFATLAFRTARMERATRKCLQRAPR